MIRRIKDSTLATLREVVYGDPYHRQFLPLVDEIDRLRAAIERVRALHAPDTLADGWQWCKHCYDSNGYALVSYPCPTLRALDGDA